MSFLPRNSRTQEYRNNGDGTQTIRCYSRSNPHYYKDSNGDYHSIDLSHTSSLNNGNVGNFTLKSKNINSLGVRQDDSKEKYIGIRPDETQDGSQQLEWTIISASVNGNNVPIDLSKNEFIDNNQVNLGNVTLFSTRKYTRQMLHYTGSINDFKLEYKLHLTGFKVSGSKYTSSTTLSNSNNVSVDTNYYKENDENEFIILDDDDNLKYKIIEPVLLDSNFEIVQTSGSVHTLRDNGDGTYNYTKYPASLSINNISSSVNYIDSTTYSTAGDDGYVSVDKTSWNAAHDATTGTADTSGDDIVVRTQVLLEGFNISAIIERGFLSFNTIGISEVTSATLNLYHKTGTQRTSYIVVEWDEGPTLFSSNQLAASDFDGFTSTTYTDAQSDDSYDADAYNSITLNSDALDELDNASKFNVCVRQHQYDYLDTSAPLGSTVKHTIIHASDISGTDKDPYVEITVVVPAAPNQYLKILSGTFDLKNGNLTIK